MTSSATWARHRLHPEIFAEEALDFHPDPWQRAVLKDRTSKRLILNCNRQAGKSTIAAIRVLHEAYFKRNALCLLCGPGARASGELFKQFVKYRDMLDPDLKEDNATSCQFASGSRVVSIPGEPDTVRGFPGVTLLCCDEAARIPDPFYAATFPMVSVSKGTAILMSTPAGACGYFWKIWTDPEAGQGWTRHAITWRECPRIDPLWIAQERREKGDRYIQAEFEGQFLNLEGGLFLAGDIQWALEAGADLKPLFPGGIDGVLPSEYDHGPLDIMRDDPAPKPKPRHEYDPSCDPDLVSRARERISLDNSLPSLTAGRPWWSR